MKWETEGCCSHQFSRKILSWFLRNSVFLKFMIHSISLLLWWFCNRISAFYLTVSGRQLHLGDFLRHQEWREGEIFHEHVRNLKTYYQIILGFQNHFLSFSPAFTIFVQSEKLIWASHTVQPCEGTCLSPVMTETETGTLAPLGWSLLLEIPYFDSLLTSTYLNQIAVLWNR